MAEAEQVMRNVTIMTNKAYDTMQHKISEALLHCDAMLALHQRTVDGRGWDQAEGLDRMAVQVRELRKLLEDLQMPF